MFKVGNETLETQTGIIVPGTITSSGSDMIIHFESDHQGTGKGFKIRVHYVLAGRNKEWTQQQINTN